jgi:hypothetical protein
LEGEGSVGGQMDESCNLQRNLSLAQSKTRPATISNPFLTLAF